MKVIESAQDLHDSLLDAGDKLVIVDLDVEAAGSFLHPKICQFAVMNRGFTGERMAACAASAAPMQLSRNLKMHWPSTARIGAALGLEESELLALAANQDLYFNYTRKPVLVPSLDDDSEDKALITAGG
ncbi:hypothetical protein OPV22_006717 [Ensete ventricosum]|uniref:Uncharacterized protein n=1 Tax=Ensete ventricosum TaxID=4639 RepID=A0AAV8RSA7_ENSVE|nr:hypothetical protein OPV22_006717 [Ensete ventricosum]